MRIRRPLALQAVGLVVVAATGILACIWYSLGTVILASLAIAIVGGLAKLAVDASIQERIPEDVRASAFAHSETLLMLAFVVGGAIGLIPFNGRLGIIVCTVGMVVAAIYAWLRAINLRRELLTGSASASPPAPTAIRRHSQPRRSDTEQPSRDRHRPDHAHRRRADRRLSVGHHRAYGRTAGRDDVPAGSLCARRAVGAGGLLVGTASRGQGGSCGRVEPGRRGARRAADRAQATAAQPTAAQPTGSQPSAAQPGRRTSGTTRVLPRTDDDQPGYHLYRPDSVRSDDDSAGT